MKKFSVIFKRRKFVKILPLIILIQIGNLINYKSSEIALIRHNYEILVCGIFYLLFVENSKIKDVSISNCNIFPLATNYERKDWHDWEFIEYEKTREGPGEQGESFELTNPDDIKLNEEIYKIEGIYGIVSDIISVNRSILDTRLPG
jgi:hypothetical protein